LFLVYQKVIESGVEDCFLPCVYFYIRVLAKLVGSGALAPPKGAEAKATVPSFARSLLIIGNIFSIFMIISQIIFS